MSYKLKRLWFKLTCNDEENDCRKAAALGFLSDFCNNYKKSINAAGSVCGSLGMSVMYNTYYSQLCFITLFLQEQGFFAPPPTSSTNNAIYIVDGVGDEKGVFLGFDLYLKTREHFTEAEKITYKLSIAQHVDNFVYGVFEEPAAFCGGIRAILTRIDNIENFELVNNDIYNEEGVN